MAIIEKNKQEIMCRYYGIIMIGVNEHIGLMRVHEGIFERYIPKDNIWIEDVELARIYEGSPEVDSINSTEAKKLKKRLRAPFGN